MKIQIHSILFYFIPFAYKFKLRLSAFFFALLFCICLIHNVYSIIYCIWQWIDKIQRSIRLNVFPIDIYMCSVCVCGMAHDIHVCVYEYADKMKKKPSTSSLAQYRQKKRKRKRESKNMGKYKIPFSSIYIKGNFFFAKNYQSGPIYILMVNKRME